MVLIRSFILTILSAFIVSGGVVFSASAQTWGTNTPATCSKDFADVMQARATMEAMREVEIAQTIILKPDSVLEYSCFNDRFADLNRADNIMFTGNVAVGSPMFNDTPLEYTPPTAEPTDVYHPTITGVVFGPNPPGSVLYHADLLGNFLGVLVTDSLLEFVYSNFGHTYGGGTFAGSAGSVCAPMQTVWGFSKCVNVGSNWFRTFLNMSLSDARTKPIACNDAARNSFWASAIAAANPEPGDSGGIVEFETFFDQFNPSKCDDSKPVPTGVRVYQGGPITDVFPDAVCPAPGCYYDGANNKCVK